MIIIPTSLIVLGIFIGFILAYYSKDYDVALDKNIEDKLKKACVHTAVKPCFGRIV